MKPEDPPDPAEVSRIVDSLLTEMGIPVEPAAGGFETAGAASRLGTDKPVSAVRAPRERFLDALHAATVGGNARNVRFGKITGEIGRVEAQKALQHLSDLAPEQRMAAAKEALAGKDGAALSKAARALVAEAAASPKGWADAMARRSDP